MKIIKVNGYKEGILTGLKMAMVIVRPRGKRALLEDDEDKYRWLERYSLYNELKEILKDEENTYTSNIYVDADDSVE